MSNIAKDFTGLPIESLIVKPLIAIAEGQRELNAVAIQYINDIGFENAEGDNGGGNVRIMPVKFDRVIDNGSGDYKKEPMEMDIPILALLQLPNVSVDEATIRFTMEVKQQETSKSSVDASVSVKAKYGSFFGSVSVSGSVSTHKENTRSTDKSAKYEIEVKAKNLPVPEGMARVMDIFVQSMQPMQVGGGS